MKKAILIIIACFFTLITFSQTENKRLEKKNLIHFSPLSLFDFINPSFQIGYERVLSSSISAKIEGGIILPRSIEGFVLNELLTSSGSTDTTGLATYSGFLWKGEVKYWFKDTRSRMGKYISIEGFYLINKGHYRSEFINSISQKSYWEWYDLDKTRIGFNVKLGIQIHWNKFIMSLSSGLGIVYRTAIHKNRSAPNDDIYPVFFEDFRWLIYDREGTDWMLNIPINYTIGFRF